MDDFPRRGNGLDKSGAEGNRRRGAHDCNAVVLRRSARAGKHPENSSKELDDGAVHQRKRSNKPDRQREDGQAILKAERSDWSVTKRQIKLFIAQVLPDDKAKPPVNRI